MVLIPAQLHCLAMFLAQGSSLLGERDAKDTLKPNQDSPMNQKTERTNQTGDCFLSL